MDELKHTNRFAEIERVFGDYFNCHLAPVMRDTQNYLGRKQAEEMAEYSTSAAGILSSMASAHNPMMDPYQTLKVTGEWNSKTTEDYLEMCKEKIAGNKDMQADLALMANEWRTAVVEEIGRERYDRLSEQLGGDLAYAYTEYRIGQMMTDKMVKDSMPKSSAEYILRKAAQNTLLGLPATLNQSPLAAEIEQRGEEAYRPSKWEKGTGKVIGAGIDVLSLGGVGSWAGFAKFVGADLAVSALVSPKGNAEEIQSVEAYISKGVFGSDSNVFDGFRKEAKEIRKGDNPYIIATNERLKKKIPVQTLDFREWMKDNTPMKMPFDFSTDPKTNDERYKDVPMVIAPAYREAYLQAMERQKADGVPRQKTDSDSATQSVRQADDTSVSSVSDVSKKPEEVAAVHNGQSQPTGQQTGNTNENGWDGLLSTLGLNGMDDIGRNMGYVFAMLPDILVGLFTGRTKSLDLKDNLLPIASILTGMFVKNPILKMLMIGLGGANLVNKAGHEALGWKKDESSYRLNGGNHPIQYRTYADEPLNPRISDPILQGSNLIATIDRVPCTIQLPEKVVAAYQAGALPLNTLANAILAKSDRTQQMMSQNYEENDRETVVRSRGVQ